MKKALLLLILATLFYGCSGKNDGPAAPLSAAIVGKWIAQKDTNYVYRNDEPVTVATGIAAGSYLVFNKNGTGMQVFNHGADDYYNFTYTISGNTVTYNVPGQTHGNFIVEGGSAVNDVVEITSQKLHLYQQSEFTTPAGDRYRAAYSMYYVKSK